MGILFKRILNHLNECFLNKFGIPYCYHTFACFVPYIVADVNLIGEHGWVSI